MCVCLVILINIIYAFFLFLVFVFVPGPRPVYISRRRSETDLTISFNVILLLYGPFTHYFLLLFLFTSGFSLPRLSRFVVPSLLLLCVTSRYFSGDF